MSRKLPEFQPPIEPRQPPATVSRNLQPQADAPRRRCLTTTLDHQPGLASTCLGYRPPNTTKVTGTTPNRGTPPQLPQTNSRNVHASRAYKAARPATDGRRRISPQTDVRTPKFLLTNTEHPTNSLPIELTNPLTPHAATADCSMHARHPGTTIRDRQRGSTTERSKQTRQQKAG